MTWKYQPVLNACIQILVTTLLGAIMAACKVFDNAFVRQAVQFVFYVALPCLVVSGLGIWIDFSSDLFIWDFIFAFLELRAIALGAAIIVVLILNRKELSWEVLGHITVSSIEKSGTVAASLALSLSILLPKAKCQKADNPSLIVKTITASLAHFLPGQVVWLSFSWISTVSPGTL